MKATIFLVLIALMGVVMAFHRDMRQEFTQKVFKNLAINENEISLGSSCALPAACKHNSDCPPLLYQNSECLGGQCKYVSIVNNQLCNSTDQCSTDDCFCRPNYLSTGCKCDYTPCVKPDMCLNGLCQSVGFVGELCGDYGMCNLGACVNGICTPQEEGATCTETIECDLDFYCNSTLKTCVQRPPCNHQHDGYCPSGSFCTYVGHGVCEVMYDIAEGQPCNTSSIECEIGLQCLDSGNGTGSVCTKVADGTPCDRSSACNTGTQNCGCSQLQNSTTECIDNGNEACVAEYQAFTRCYYTSNCIDYDINNATESNNNCSKNCLSLQTAYMCCQICSYPEYNANAFFNLQGSCADQSVQPVQCCQEEEPCTILPAAKLCEGYKLRE